jgi:hypothetical protein
MTRNLSEAMTSKYSMYNLNPEMWRELFWQRDMNKEQALKELLNIKGEYCLIFNEFGNITDGGASRKDFPITEITLPIILSKRLPNYTLLDWSGIIENATIIHAVLSSNIYLFEMLNLKAKEVHLYSRRLGEKDFEMVRPILTKDYILHI